MRRLPLVFVTSRPEKAEEARRFGFEVETLHLDLPELQSLDSADVVEAKARAAHEKIGRPVLVEDSGLALSAWGGFPGALVRWLEKSAGVAAIPRMLGDSEDRRATAICVVAWFNGARLVTARGECAGEISRGPRGDSGFGWDSIFIPEGSGQTFAELGPAGKDRLSHRRRAWEALSARMPEGVL
ncbi:MAG: non-canonical purine NTP pyrophosphatase [Acidobacteriota bacterium]|nr:non-canonical purine NTP pyrophosphatase [Acidobacteriota bacterium]